MMLLTEYWALSEPQTKLRAGRSTTIHVLPMRLTAHEDKALKLWIAQECNCTTTH